MDNPSDVDKYIAAFSKEIQEILERLRSTIKNAAPGAEQRINYGIPTFTLIGNLVHFAAFKNHIGFYPAPSGILAFKKELSVYEGAKGSIKFPIDKPLPFDLIKEIVKYRVKENLEKAEAKKRVSTCSMGHKYNRSSQCPACPVCERERRPKENFLSILSAPARRALANKGILNLKQLSAFSEKEIVELHGMGPGSITKLKTALEAKGLSFNRF